MREKLLNVSCLRNSPMEHIYFSEVVGIESFVMIFFKIKFVLKIC